MKNSEKIKKIISDTCLSNDAKNYRLQGYIYVTAKKVEELEESIKLLQVNSQENLFKEAYKKVPK